MNDISLGGWVAIGIIAVLFLVTNLSLFSLLRKKESDHSNSSILADTIKTLKNPWEKEDQHLQQLSEKVTQLKKNQNQNIIT